MGGEISFTPLGSLVDEARGISYGVVQPGQHVDDGVPIVRVTDIRHGRINQVDPLKVAPEIADKYRRTVLRGGELLLTLVGTVGETAVVPASLAGWNTARAVAVLPVLDEPGPRWVQYALQTGPAREYIQTRLNTTVQATLNLGDVTTLPIPMPPREARERILKILGALDDKIELNRKTNATLEAMARALFKSWFVDFDPVRAKAEGRAPSGMDAETARLFPNALVESQLGPIPKGWTVEPLDTIADFRNGLALQKFRPEEGEPRLPVVKIAQLRTGQPDSGEWSRADIVPDCILENGDVVFSWSGSLTVVVWCGGRAALNQHLFKVTSTAYPKWFYLQWLLEHLPEFQRIAGDKATTMGHIQRHHLTAANCVVPPGDLIDATDRLLAPMLEQRVALDLESRHLARVRDELLPRLLSGALDVGSMTDAQGAS